LKIRSNAATRKLGTTWRTLAAVACISVLSGCESFPEVPSFDDVKTGFSATYDKTVSAIDKAWNDADADTTAAASDNEVTVALDRPAAKRLQARLAKLGYQSGRPDGVIGAKTKKAIRRYQSAHSLPVNGKISLQLLEHLEANADDGSARDVLTSSPKN
jgi:hypothetical protein